VSAPAPLSADEFARYGRQLLLPPVGVEGQMRLQRARVLVVGAGGLGSPVALYLAAAGVGTLGLVDDDAVDVTNLHRQVLYGTRDVGRPKLDAATARLRDLNPHVAVEASPVRLTTANALALVAGHDLVVDGTDNFAARYAVNDACVAAGVPNVYGSVHRFEGQVSVFAAPGGLRGGPPDRGPCYRCLYPAPPPDGSVPSCAEGGVFGVLPGLVGMLQATEALKLLLGIGEPLVGRCSWSTRWPCGSSPWPSPATRRARPAAMPRATCPRRRPPRARPPVQSHRSRPRSWPPSWRRGVRAPGRRSSSTCASPPSGPPDTCPAPATRRSPRCTRRPPRSTSRARSSPCARPAGAARWPRAGCARSVRRTCAASRAGSRRGGRGGARSPHPAERRRGAGPA
jgi:molybdopterin/thiamine biosynthesis adenylyltransferase